MKPVHLAADGTAQQVMADGRIQSHAAPSGKPPVKDLILPTGHNAVIQQFIILRMEDAPALDPYLTVRPAPPGKGVPESRRDVAQGHHPFKGHSV